MLEKTQKIPAQWHEHHVLKKKKHKKKKDGVSPSDTIKCCAVGLERVSPLSIFETFNASHKVPNRRPSYLFAYQPASPDTDRHRHAEIRAFRGSASLITSSSEKRKWRPENADEVRQIGRAHV